jgi:predicted enzyme related to lactoylglutathione lyase
VNGVLQLSSVTRTYFMLNVHDMARAVAFYREVLGPVVRFESEQISELKLGAATIALTVAGGKPRDLGLVVEVVDLAAACAAVVRMGGRVLEGPNLGADGVVVAEVLDSEGNGFVLAGEAP